LDDLELDCFSFGKSPEAFSQDGRVVDEDVRTVVLRDEPEALRIIEPLHSTFVHDQVPLQLAARVDESSPPWYLLTRIRVDAQER
jgi:hypothetical protein